MVCFFPTTQDDLNFKETEMHKSQSTAAILGSGKMWLLHLYCSFSACTQGTKLNLLANNETCAVKGCLISEFAFVELV